MNCLSRYAQATTSWPLRSKHPHQAESSYNQLSLYVRCPEKLYKLSPNLPAKTYQAAALAKRIRCRVFPWPPLSRSSVILSLITLVLASLIIRPIAPAFREDFGSCHLYLIWPLVVLSDVWPK